MSEVWKILVLTMGVFVCVFAMIIPIIVVQVFGFGGNEWFIVMGLLVFIALFGFAGGYSFRFFQEEDDE